MFWKNKNTEKRLNEIHNLLINSFGNVKGDTNSIFQWLEYLYNEKQNQDSTIRDLQLQLKNMPTTKEQIKEIIDKHYSYESVLERIKEMHAKIDNIALRQKPLLTEIENLSLRMNTIEQKSPKTAIREKIIRKITKNSKDYVKNLITSLIKKYERISALQLREIVVEEQGLCSKSSFYRLVAELEENEAIVAVQERKEKYYLSEAANFNSNR